MIYKAWFHGALYGESDTEQDARDIAECAFRDDIYRQNDDLSVVEFLDDLVVEKVGDDE